MIPIRAWLNRTWGFLRHYVGGLYNNLGEHHVFLLAGGLAFSFFVCIIPLTLIVFAIIGGLLEKGSLTSELNSLVDKVVPYQSYASHVKRLVSSRVDEFRIYKGVAGLIGTAGLLFAASGLFASMRTILNTVYQIRSSQSIYLRKLKDIGLVLLVVVYFLLATTLLPSISIIHDFADRIEILSPFDLRGIAEIGMEAASVVVILIAFVALYFLVPQQRLSKGTVLLSAMWAAGLWKAAEQLFGYYITEMANVREVYGAYSLTIAVVFWIYYTSIVFIIGAEIGQLYRTRHSAGTVATRMR
jgi:membrane protein